MFFPQAIVFFTVGIGLLLFSWGRFRYDIISLMLLLVIALAAVMVPGIIPVEQVFWGFGHEAVMIVASMFVLGKGLISAGVVDVLARYLNIFGDHPAAQLFTLILLTVIVSAFVNNVGALALIIPIAYQTAKKSGVSPAMFLLPLALASHLGGFLTLVGTPRNLIISSFREQAGYAPFNMFDFIYVGGGVAVAGIIFLTVAGLLFFKNRKVQTAHELFEIQDYVTEVKIPEGSKFVGHYLKDLPDIAKVNFTVTALLRDDHRVRGLSGFEVIRPEDVLLIESESEVLTDIIESNHLTLVGKMAEEKNVTPHDDHGAIEAVVPPTSALVGRNWENVPLDVRYGVNLLAISRAGEKIRTHLNHIKFKPSDVLVLEGRKESIHQTLQTMDAYPLEDRALTLGRNTRIWTALLIFITAVVLATMHIIPLAIVFLTGAVLMVLSGIISLKQAYESIDFPVLVLLGSMLTLGLALETSGGAATVASFLLNMNTVMTPSTLLLLLLVISMWISDLVNTTASAVIMAPIAIILAQSIGASVDPFLMAVAIGASSAFLTPNGHESNAMVMEQGGYSYKDYIKVGLPMELLVVAISFPLILYFWPLY